MNIIDFEKKGNVVRFYLGDASQEYWGDDWDDAPYDCNAGTVYDKYIKGYVDVAFDFDTLVMEPCDVDTLNCGYCKQDMKMRRVPCLVIVPKDIQSTHYDVWNDDFLWWMGAEGVKKFYFGDDRKKVLPAKSNALCKILKEGDYKQLMEKEGENGDES